MAHLCLLRVPNAAVPPLIRWEEPRPKDARAAAFRVSYSEKQGTIETRLPRELGMGRVGVASGRKSRYPQVLHYSEPRLPSRPDLESSPSVLAPRRRSSRLEPRELRVSGRGGAGWACAEGARGAAWGSMGGALLPGWAPSTVPPQLRVEAGPVASA